MDIEFEFDPDKSKANKDKHGIDFVEAQALWNDEDALEVFVFGFEEERFVLIGKADQKYWTAVITYRDENIRIISVRRSRKKEIAAYEGQK